MADRSSARRRVVFVHGPWQLLMATAAIRQATPPEAAERAEDLLVIFPLGAGPATPELAEVMERLAGATWTWRRVVPSVDPVHDMSRPAVARAIASLREVIGGGEPAEIWLDCLWGSFEKVAAEAFPSSGIILYEDGLHTYVETEDHHLSIAQCLRRPRRSYRSIRARLSQRRNDGSIGAWPLVRRHLDRVRSSYLWIERIVPAPAYQRHLPRVRLQTESLRRTIRDAAAVAPEPPLPAAITRSEGPKAMVLGQCFSNYGDLARDREFECYLDTVKRLRNAGFSVLWKEHPRTREPFLSDLSAAIDGIEAMPELGPWPVELFAERMGLACCAAVSSTSLFSFPLLFGLPAYTMIDDRLLPLFRHPNDQMARLVVSHVPPVGRAYAPAEAHQNVVFASSPSRFHGKPWDYSGGS